MRFVLSTVLGAVFALSACDAVRLPGDGREPPGPDPVIPDGAPGPQPPLVPVTDPYGTGETETPGTTDAEAKDEVETGAGEPTETDPDTVDSTDSDPEGATPEDSGEDTATEVSDAPDETSDRIPTETETETETETDTETETEPEPEPLPVKFQYYPPGDLIPGSGIGSPDATVYVPDMIFPVKDAPSYPQSQVWRFGGYLGGDGGQCDERNFSAPWRDNFCETRSKTRNTPLCPEQKVHQGQDIRIGTPSECRQMVAMRPEKPTLHSIVAVEDGVITNVASYWITLRGSNTGNLYNYIHLNMGALKVTEDETVTAGQELGYASNDFGGTPTTFHLHFEIKAPVEGEGFTHVPPYMSLVASYERRENGRGELIEDDTVAVASVPILPEGIEIIE